MNILQDKTGIYRLDAVAAITPLLTHIHAVPDASGTMRALPLARPDRIVAVLHMAGGQSFQTDTDFDVVAEEFAPVLEPAKSTEVATTGRTA